MSAVSRAFTKNIPPISYSNENVSRNKIVEWLNAASVGDLEVKVQSISKVQEILLSSSDDLLDEFLENILFFSHDCHQDVRKSVIGFIEQVCKTKIAYMPRLVSVLTLLLKDKSPQVIKRVIQACSSVYKNALKWLCECGEVSENAEKSWDVLCFIKAQILDMIDSENDGIRTNCVKFLEGIVILQSYRHLNESKSLADFSLDEVPLTLKFARRRKLEDEARHIFDCLIKFHEAAHISSVNLITCTGSLCAIAKKRPFYLRSVIDALKKLQSNLPPTLTDSQVSSVRKHIKMQLFHILKTKAVIGMQGDIIDILQDLGATSSEIMKILPKYENKQYRYLKRSSEDIAQILGKKCRNEEHDFTEMVIENHSQDAKNKVINTSNIIMKLKNAELAVQLVMTSMKNLPHILPPKFLKSFVPINNLDVGFQICKIATFFAKQYEEKDKELTKRIYGTAFPDKQMPNKFLNDKQTAEDIDKKKKFEISDKFVGESLIIQRMKMRVKSFKLQEVTKPLPRVTKEKIILNTINRILQNKNRRNVSFTVPRQQKLLTMIAVTFSESSQELILKFILDDLKNRLDIAFSWLYEEYCLLQGFTRHLFIKDENKPDYAYNKLLKNLVYEISKSEDSKERICMLRKIFLEAPYIPEDSIQQLYNICKSGNISEDCIELIKDITLLRPSKQQAFLKMLLTFSVSEDTLIRTNATKSIIALYAISKVNLIEIEEFALKWLTFLETDAPPPDIFDVIYDRPEHKLIWDENLVKICLNMFLAILPYHSEWMLQLNRSFITSIHIVKKIMLRMIDEPIIKMGVNNDDLMEFIKRCPNGAETLITRIIHILTEKQVPSEKLVSCVRELYQNQLPDVRILIPIINELTKNEIITILPKLLKLNTIIVKEVFNRLINTAPRYYKIKPLTASEIFVALHTIDVSKCELKYIVKATSICLDEKNIFTQDIMAGCLQQLVDISPIPTLLMRTIIQSLSLYPKLAPFIINLLQRLILKQVWKQKIVWDGFLKCCQKLKPESFPVILQLPETQLLEALSQCADLKISILEYIKYNTENQSGLFSQKVMQILTESSNEDLIKSGSIGQASADETKLEKKCLLDEQMPNSIQPLPPGDE